MNLLYCLKIFMAQFIAFMVVLEAEYGLTVPTRRDISTDVA
jgi:hypothetical protein